MHCTVLTFFLQFIVCGGLGFHFDHRYSSVVVNALVVVVLSIGDGGNSGCFVQFYFSTMFKLCNVPSPPFFLRSFFFLHNVPSPQFFLQNFLSPHYLNNVQSLQCSICTISPQFFPTLSISTLFIFCNVPSTIFSSILFFTLFISTMFNLCNVPSPQFFIASIFYPHYLSPQCFISAMFHPQFF